MNTNPAHGLLSALRTANVERQKEWKGSEGITLPFHANELYGECGELANVLKKILRLQTGIQGDLRLPSYELRNSLAHELADVVICADLLLNHLAIRPLKPEWMLDWIYAEDPSDILYLMSEIAKLSAKVFEISILLDVSYSDTRNLSLQHDMREFHELVVATEKMVMLVKAIAVGYSVDLRLAIPRKFNQTSGKMGLSTRMEIPAGAFTKSTSPSEAESTAKTGTKNE
mgnify:CR=1 FL=1